MTNKLVCLLIPLIAGAAALSPHEYEKLMNNEELSWQPVHPKESRFFGWSHSEMQGLMGLSSKNLVGADQERVEQSFFNVDSSTPLPAFFDARQKFPSCSGKIRNQAHCGSCWAFGGAETLSDNLCVDGTHTAALSAQDLVSCDTVDHGCKGGDLIDLWKRLVDVGVVDQMCMPYTAENGTVAACPGYCTGAGEFTRYKCGKSNMLEDERAIKNGILNMGAAETGFYVYEDFMDYKSGVYSHDNTTSNMPLGGHAVKIIGWGEESGLKYWLVANSWGPAWGMDGYFKISMTDKDSAFALGGAFNCGKYAPAPPAPAPGPSPSTCKDILPSDECSDDPKDCVVRQLVCRKTCRCCDWPNPPSYCSNSTVAAQVENAMH